MIKHRISLPLKTRVPSQKGSLSLSILSLDTADKPQREYRRHPVTFFTSYIPIRHWPWWPERPPNYWDRYLKVIHLVTFSQQPGEMRRTKQTKTMNCVQLTLCITTLLKPTGIFFSLTLVLVRYIYVNLLPEGITVYIIILLMHITFLLLTCHLKFAAKSNFVL